MNQCVSCVRLLRGDFCGRGVRQRGHQTDTEKWDKEAWPGYSSG